MTWVSTDDRHSKMKYNRPGRLGLKLPTVSFGLRHNFGGDTPHDRNIDMCRTVFDLGLNELREWRCSLHIRTV